MSATANATLLGVHAERLDDHESRVRVLERGQLEMRWLLRLVALLALGITGDHFGVQAHLLRLIGGS